MRFAIIATPRTGNTWLMHMLGKVFNVPATPVHNPTEVEWDNLPPGCVLQLHWHPFGSFVDSLERAGFRVVVLSRHPLDVLMSILHFSLHDPTSRWLEGEEGNERPIFGAMPRSTAFMNYATGPRARALLGVSMEWWSFPGSIRVRYEDLLTNPQGELRRLIEAAGVVPDAQLETVIAEHTIPHMRKRTQNAHHFWQGKAGLWKRLLTAREAVPIGAAHAALFQTLSYRCDPDPDLDGTQADANWLNLVWSELTDDLHDLRQTKRRLSDAEAELEQVRAALASIREAYDTLRANVGDVGPGALAVARRISRISHRYPHATAVMKKWFRRAG